MCIAEMSSLQLLLVGEKKHKRLCSCIGGSKSDSEKDLIYSIPRRLLVKWVGIDFFFLKIKFDSVTVKTISESR